MLFIYVDCLTARQFDYNVNEDLKGITEIG